jgi:hypothetical protein
VLGEAADHRADREARAERRRVPIALPRSDAEGVVTSEVAGIIKARPLHRARRDQHLGIDGGAAVAE